MITLKYKFYDVPYSSYDPSGVWPKGTEYYSELDYEYDLDVTIDMVKEYFNIKDDAFKRVVEIMIKEGIIDWYNIQEDLQENEGFIEWATEKFYDKAYDKCCEELNG